MLYMFYYVMVAHFCNPSTLGGRAGKNEFQTSMEKIRSQKKKKKKNEEEEEDDEEK